jgi:hypothetical protein
MLERGVGNMINDFDVAREHNPSPSRIKMLLKYQGGNYVGNMQKHQFRLD